MHAACQAVERPGESNVRSASLFSTVMRIAKGKTGKSTGLSAKPSRMAGRLLQDATG